MSEKFRVRPPVLAWVFWAIAVWHMAIVITTITAFVLDPSAEYAWFHRGGLRWI